MQSIHDFKKSKLKKYYGASKPVYRAAHVERLLRMWDDLSYLSESWTRTRLVPANHSFLHKKAIPAYNSTLKRLQAKYPDITEFQQFKPHITHDLE